MNEELIIKDIHASPRDYEKIKELFMKEACFNCHKKFEMLTGGDCYSRVKNAYWRNFVKVFCYLHEPIISTTVAEKNA